MTSLLFMQAVSVSTNMIWKALSVSTTPGIVSTKQEIMQNHRMQFILRIEKNKLAKHMMESL